MATLSFSLTRGTQQLRLAVTAADNAACVTAAQAYAQAFANLTPGKRTQLQYSLPAAPFLGVQVEDFTPAGSFTTTQAVLSGVTVVAEQ